MPVYHKQGKVPPKRHVQFRNADGGLYHEELFGRRGFDGPYSLLYHLHPPTQFTKVEQISDANVCQPIEDPLFRHRHFRLAKAAHRGDPVTGRRQLLVNEDVSIAVCIPAESMDYLYCNGVGDELIFVHEGSGSLNTMFGDLRYGPGDYIVIPKGTTYRLHADCPNPSRFLVLETPGCISLPKKYHNEYGQLLEHSPFCARDFRLPGELNTIDQLGEFAIKIKTQRGIMLYTLNHHPFDVVGWDGYLYPWIFNIHDFEPITGRIHQPPSVHQTFAGPNFVVCSFVPRLVDYHPLAIPAPYNHSNIDSDEVLYYVGGSFMSRKGIDAGSVTFHPAGIPHGPQPGTVQASIGGAATEELAVMIDTFRPLRLAQHALEFDDSEYPLSWSKLQLELAK